MLGSWCGVGKYIGQLQPIDFVAKSEVFALIFQNCEPIPRLMLEISISKLHKIQFPSLKD